MTFESIDDDEYEAAATRPRPRRRLRGRNAGRRRQAIVDLLDEYGPLTRDELAAELRRRSIRSRPLNRDLFALIVDARVVCYRDPEDLGWPRQHLYRLATAGEKAEALRIDALLHKWMRAVPLGAEPPF